MLKLHSHHHCMMQHVIEQATLEAVEDAEQQEAWFRHLSQDYDGFKQAEIYQNNYFKWLKQPMSAHTAYIQRACMGLQTKCYLQVYQNDVAAAVCNYNNGYWASQFTDMCDAGKMGLPASYQVVAASTSGTLMLLSILGSCLQTSGRLSTRMPCFKAVSYLQI